MLALPDGWFCVWCPDCFATISWTREDMQTYVLENWLMELDWTIKRVDHDFTMHTIGSIR